MMIPHAFDVPVRGGALHAGRWGEEGPLVVGLHGITANHLSLVALGEELGSWAQFVAPDLRGRAGSAALPGPFGLESHVADVVALLDALGARRCVVVGHSMGAFVGVVLAAAHPERVSGLVLVDGGLPLTLPQGLAPDAVLAAVLGPALARLSMTFADRGAYLDYWREHPALADWDARIERYLDHDLVGEAPVLRSSVSLDAVREDGTELVTGDAVARALADPSLRGVLVRAERGILDDAPLYPASFRSGANGIRVTPAVPGTNHYTVVFREQGVAEIALRVRELVGAPGER